MPIQLSHLADLILTSESDTQKLAIGLAKLPLFSSVWLSGDLGSGKTTLTRYWLQALGYQGAVKSPTYTLVEPYLIHNHATIEHFYHADLYRLQDSEELSFIGFDEYLDDPKALIVIEWASKADDYLPPPILFIDIKRLSNEDRQVHIRLSRIGIERGLDLSKLSF